MVLFCTATNLSTENPFHLSLIKLLRVDLQSRLAKTLPSPRQCHIHPRATPNSRPWMKTIAPSPSAPNVLRLSASAIRTHLQTTVTLSKTWCIPTGGMEYGMYFSVSVCLPARQSHGRRRSSRRSRLFRKNSQLYGT